MALPAFPASIFRYFVCCEYDFLLPSQVGTPASVPFATIFLNLSMTVLVPLILGQVHYSVCVTMFIVMQHLTN